MVALVFRVCFRVLHIRTFAAVGDPGELPVWRFPNPAGFPHAKRGVYWHSCLLRGAFWEYLAAVSVQRQIFLYWHTFTVDFLIGSVCIWPFICIFLINSYISFPFNSLLPFFTDKLRDFPPPWRNARAAVAETFGVELLWLFLGKWAASHMPYCSSWAFKKVEQTAWVAVQSKGEFGLKHIRAAPGGLRTPVKIRWKPSNCSEMWAIVRRASRGARSAVRRWFWSGNGEDVGQTTHLKIPQPKGLCSRVGDSEPADREYYFSVSQSMRPGDAQGNWGYRI